MSPERIQESGYSFSSDVWSLGCVLYELITLNSPFSIMNQEQNLAAQQQNLNPYNLQWIIDRIIRAEYPSLDGYQNISPRLRYLTTECLNPAQEARPDMTYICAVVNGIQTSNN
jgi:serine/threonine protein kinase